MLILILIALAIIAWGVWFIAVDLRELLEKYI